MALTIFDRAQTQPEKNILINGGFEFWQRNTTFTAPADAVYLADRWQMRSSEPTNVTVTKETTTVDSTGLASMKVVVTSTTASKYWIVRQPIENYADLRGKTVSVSARVKTTVATAIRVAIGDENAFQAFSSYHTGSGNWETLTATYTYGASIVEAKIALGMLPFDKKDGTYYFDNVMLAFGPNPVSFVPTDPQVELAQCQRYYYKTFNPTVTPAQNTGSSVGALGYSIHTTGVFNDVATLTFPVQMRTTPTIVTYSPGAATANWYNLSAGVASGVPTVIATLSARHADIRNPQIAVTDVAGQFAVIHVTAEAEMF